jgi:RNA 3'-terminal phosphate cyclase (ATP)
MSRPLIIDGSQGEGGGQILRTALSLAAIEGRAVRIEKIRAGRPNPGLAAQHVTCVRAVGALCRADVAGDEIGSRHLDFAPGAVVQAGDYGFDISAARKGGSAGATGLVMQAVLLPLALAQGDSRVSVRGGTHVAWSPPFDYLQQVWLPALNKLGIAADLNLRRSGWYPVGEGEIHAMISGLGPERQGRLKPLALLDRGPLQGVTGRAIAANLPLHIARRMAARARDVLEAEGIDAAIDAEAAKAASRGAGLFLTARYQAIACGFSALGERGKRAEQVGEEAAEASLAHWRSGAALDRHLADQILLPLALARGPSSYSAQAITQHLRSNAFVIERFGLAEVGLSADETGAGTVNVTPAAE